MPCLEPVITTALGEPEEAVDLTLGRSVPMPLITPKRLTSTTCRKVSGVSHDDLAPMAALRASRLTSSTC